MYASTSYLTDAGEGELEGRTKEGLEIRLETGTRVTVPMVGMTSQTAAARLLPPPGTTHPPRRSHPQFSRVIPHGINAGYTFSLPPVFSEPAPGEAGHALWEEAAVRPDLMDELSNYKVLPAHWHAWLGDPQRGGPQLSVLQTTGSGDCLLNALSLGICGVQDRTPSLQRGDSVMARLMGGSPRRYCARICFSHVGGRGLFAGCSCAHKGQQNSYQGACV